MYRLYRVRFQCDIPYQTELDGVHICHTGFGVVINPNSVIGRGTIIQHGVTIGEKNGACPTIGENCRIGARAIIIGGISIGDNVIVGAGAVVVSDIPSNTTVAGVPARAIKSMKTGGEKNENQ